MRTIYATLDFYIFLPKFLHKRNEKNNDCIIGCHRTFVPDISLAVNQKQNENSTLEMIRHTFIKVQCIQKKETI